MNIIGNTCAGSYLTRDYYKEEFSNPFCWNVIDYTSLYNLIEKFDSIDFYNIDLAKDAKFNISLIIDDIVKVQYVHYKFSPAYNKPTIKNDHDVLYNKIWEFIVEKYNTRLKRMKDKNEPPIFIIQNINCLPATTTTKVKETKNDIEAKLQKIIDLNSPYKCVFILPNYCSFHFTNLHKNIVCVYTNDYTRTDVQAKEIFKLRNQL